MPVYDVTKSVGFMVRRVADPIMVSIASGVIAPVVAPSMVTDGSRGVATLTRIECWWSKLVGVANERGPSTDAVFANIAQVESDLVCGNQASRKPLLFGLMDKHARLLTENEVAEQLRAVG